MAYNMTMGDKDVIETRFLHQPRGPGKGWVFRMATPELLIGQPNPKSGKPFGKTIHEGLGTRDLREARRLRDIRIGELRLLERKIATGEDGLLFDREQWLETRQRLEKAGDHEQVEAIEHAYQDITENRAAKTGDEETAARWYRTLTGRAVARSDLSCGRLFRRG